jgi:hypothetical protein
MWVVKLIKEPTPNTFRSNFFPRQTHYKESALVLKAEIESKGGEAIVEKVIKKGRE